MIDINLEKITDAVRLVASKPILVAILAIPSISHLFLLVKSSFLIKASYIFVLINMFAIPIIYGIYLEIIKGKKTSLIDISKKHILNYLLVILIIYLPIFALAFTKTLLGSGYFILNLFLRTGIDIATIYVLPFAYLTGYIFKSIIAGTVFTVTNIKKNLDLVVTSIVAGIFAFLVNGYLYIIFKEITIPAASLSFLLGYASTCITCVVFVLACIRLKKITIEV